MYSYRRKKQFLLAGYPAAAVLDISRLFSMAGLTLYHPGVQREETHTAERKRERIPKSKSVIVRRTV